MSQEFLLHVDQDIPISRVKPWLRQYAKNKYSPKRKPVDTRSMKEKLAHVSQKESQSQSPLA